MSHITTIKLTSSSYMHGDTCNVKTVTLRVNKFELKALWSMYGRLGFSEIEVLEEAN